MLVLALDDCNGSTPNGREFVLGAGNGERMAVSEAALLVILWKACVLVAIVAVVCYVLLNTSLALR